MRDSETPEGTEKGFMIIKVESEIRKEDEGKRRSRTTREESLEDL